MNIREDLERQIMELREDDRPYRDKVPEEIALLKALGAYNQGYIDALTAATQSRPVDAGERLSRNPETLEMLEKAEAEITHAVYLCPHCQRPAEQCYFAPCAVRMAERNEAQLAGMAQYSASPQMASGDQVAEDHTAHGCAKDSKCPHGVDSRFAACGDCMDA